jgi:hypothetical protein
VRNSADMAAAPAGRWLDPENRIASTFLQKFTRCVNLPKQDAGRCQHAILLNLLDMKRE